ncbi:MAG: 3-phosphoserine/phosphohydroxythreonine transaminase [Spirochaetaceae bacterium]|nr:3-phosphoserine/phosphohydroxythreonine transaminase [Spirochaetaceae bacterium]
MNRVYNFSAGPSQLPEEVLAQARDEMLNYNESGQSVMEMSHRSRFYEPIIEETEALVRELLGVSDDYYVLFLQGGATLQFSCIPLNLKRRGKAAYVDTGVWANKAWKEGGKFLQADCVASSADEKYRRIPEIPEIQGDYDYLHITMNNTIMGTKYSAIPCCGEVPLVADISSCILSEPLDVSRFALLYAGAQKNLAPAGVTLVVVKKDLCCGVGNAPLYLDYKIHAESGSMYNTPPCYTIYMMNLVLKWIRSNGGAAAMEKRNKEKADLLYNYLDSGDFFWAPVEKGSRSLMNVPFLIRNVEGDLEKELNKKFVSEAESHGLINLAGHRLAGGMRASIYNAMPLAGVEALIRFMEDFAKENRHKTRA